MNRAQIDSGDIVTGLGEDEILGLAQTQAESPNAAVKLTPQVHVQVTRVGHN